MLIIELHLSFGCFSCDSDQHEDRCWLALAWVPFEVVDKSALDWEHILDAFDPAERDVEKLQVLSMRKYPKLSIPLDHLIVEPIHVLYQKLLVALEEKPDLILQLGHVCLFIPGGAAVEFLADMLVLFGRLILQEEADEAFELVLDLPAAHERALVAVLLGEAAFVAELGGLDQLAAVAVDWLLEFR